MYVHRKDEKKIKSFKGKLITFVSLKPFASHLTNRTESKQTNRTNRIKTNDRNQFENIIHVKPGPLAFNTQCAMHVMYYKKTTTPS
jgi:hypothetical protein